MKERYYLDAKAILENKNSTMAQIKEARELLLKAIELDEKYVDGLFALACCEKKLTNYHKALEYLEKVLTIEPDAILSKALKKLILQKYIVK